MDSGWRIEQIGWWCGIVSPVLIVAGFFSIDEGGTTPSDGAIGDLVHEIVSSHSRIIAGSLVGMVGSLLLVWFGSSLRSRLSADNRGVFIGAAGYGFTIVMTTGALGHGAFRLGLTSIENRELLAEAMRPLAILGSHTLRCVCLGDGRISNCNGYRLICDSSPPKNNGTHRRPALNWSDRPCANRSWRSWDCPFALAIRGILIPPWSKSPRTGQSLEGDPPRVGA